MIKSDRFYKNIQEQAQGSFTAAPGRGFKHFTAAVSVRARGPRFRAGIMDRTTSFKNRVRLSEK